MKQSNNMVFSDTNLEKIQGMIFESQKSMAEHVFSLALDFDQINFKKGQDKIIRYIDWQIKQINSTAVVQEQSEDKSEIPTLSQQNEDEV